jgi:uncharacterized protein (TIGR02646 family)
MIKIKRNDSPASLQKQDDEFVKDDYKNDDVKGSLMEMQHGKCCYCERDIKKAPSTEREVEHYIPKSAFKDENGNISWHLANKWENLMYACRTCNSRKSNKRPFNEATNEREIIDPSFKRIDPEDHIDFVFDDILINFKPKESSSLGKSTIEKMRFLERKDLFGEFRRIKAHMEIHFIDLINALEGNNVTEITSLRNELSRAMSAHIPFAAFHRKFIKKRLGELNEYQIPKLEDRYNNKSFERIEINFPKGYETVI